MVDKNMEIWEKVKQPPLEALKKIKGGRIGGMTNIDPQWRYQIMTEIFGPIGFGWSYRTIRLWCENGAKGEICAFSEIALRVKLDGEWSEEIAGNGGSMLVAGESKGPHTSDEAYKMATTDALSVAMKQLGVAADIYLGNFDGSKYLDSETTPPPKPTPTQKPSGPSMREVYKDVDTPITDHDVKVLCTKITSKGKKVEDFNKWMLEKYSIDSKKKIPKMLYFEILDIVEAM